MHDFFCSLFALVCVGCKLSLGMELARVSPFGFVRSELVGLRLLRDLRVEGKRKLLIGAWLLLITHLGSKRAMSHLASLILLLTNGTKGLLLDLPIGLLGDLGWEDGLRLIASHLLKRGTEAR